MRIMALAVCNYVNHKGHLKYVSPVVSTGALFMLVLWWPIQSGILPCECLEAVVPDNLVAFLWI